MRGISGIGPCAAACALVLRHAGMACGTGELALLTGLTRKETVEAVRMLEEIGLARREAGVCTLLPGTEHADAGLLTILKRDSSMRESCASLLCLYLEGNLVEFFDRALELLETCGEAGKSRELFCSYEFFAGLIMKIRLRGRDREFSFQFIEKCMKLQKISFRFPYVSKFQVLVFYKIRGVAFVVGDIRSIGYIDIQIGTLNITLKGSYETLYYRRMEKGYKTILSIGDRDIILRSAEKILLYYIIESRFAEALAFFHSVVFCEDEDISFYINTSIFIYAASSATYLGNFLLAEQILELGIDKIRTLRKGRLTYDEASGINTMRAMTAFLLIWQNRHREALRIIRDILTAPHSGGETYASLWASRALAFCYYREGNPEGSWQSFREWMTCPESTNQVHSNYFIATFVLDLLYSYHAEGRAFPAGWSFARELEFAESSPFLILKANALRISGQMLEEVRGPGCPEAGEKLRRSLEVFRSINAPVDMAKTLIALAQFHQNAGAFADAAQAASRARRICRAYSPSFFPEELVPLAEQAPAYGEWEQGAVPDLRTNFLRALKTNMLTDIEENAFSSMLGALLGALGMMSGCVLRHRNGKFERQASKNFGKDGEERAFLLAAESCAASSSLFRVLEEGEISVIYAQAAIVLHVRLEIYGHWVFYAEGPILRTIFSLLAERQAGGLEDIVAAWLTVSRKKEQRLEEATPPPPARPAEEGMQMVFASEAMRRIVRQADTVACKDTAVLLLGESGCGKEVIAQRLHEKSGRKGNFVCVNLSNLPYDLFESECFGYEKGSFTGAQRQKIGLFELADNGTLFIDEVGDMPLPIQIKLLRVLQSKKFMRIGGTKSIYSNFRLVCATSRDLRRSVAEGTFREDLYYRINVVTIRIPPLRERREDIVRLARHFLRYYAEHHNVTVPELTGEELERIASWSWPGNVRQLKNYMERFCILKDGVLEELGGTAGGAESPAAGQDSPVPGLLTGTPSLKELEDAYFESIYRKTAGEVGGEGGIAAILGISRSTAYAWIDRLRLRERYHRELRRNDDAG